MNLEIAEKMVYTYLAKQNEWKTQFDIRVDLNQRVFEKKKKLRGNLIRKALYSLKKKGKLVYKESQCQLHWKTTIHYWA